MEHTYFTQAEAEAKIGTRVRALLESCSVPRGTTGTVTHAIPLHLAAPDESAYIVAITWELPGQRTKPMDWFTAREYAQRLTEIHEHPAQG